MQDATKAGKLATAIVCEHSTFDPKEDVLLKDTIVREYFFRGKWHKQTRARTAKEVTDSFIELIDKR